MDTNALIKNNKRDDQGDQFNPDNVMYDKNNVVITEWWGSYECEINVYVKGKHVFKGGYIE